MTTSKSKRKSQKKLRDYASAIKLDSGCELCGYNEHAFALQFDHIDPKTKYKPVASLVGQQAGIKVIEEEIAKCRVLCANCHAIHTHDPDYFETKDPKQFELFEDT